VPWAETQLVRRSLGEDGSIKNNKLCETKPISKRPKMIVTLVLTMANNKKQRTTNYSKQTQTNPIYGEQSRTNLIESRRKLRYIYAMA
jgi:hypothetical protein